MFTYKYFLLIFLILIFILHFYTPTYTYPTSPSLPYYTIFQVYCPLILSHPIDFDKHIYQKLPHHKSHSLVVEVQQRALHLQKPYFH